MDINSKYNYCNSSLYIQRFVKTAKHKSYPVADTANKKCNAENSTPTLKMLHVL